MEGVFFKRRVASETTVSDAREGPVTGPELPTLRISGKSMAPSLGAGSLL